MKAWPPSLDAGRDRLVLGTAQLGMRYGIANRTGKPDRDQTLRIIRTAWESGIRIFDTAQGYGESEERLAKCLKELGVIQDAQVFSKIDPEIDHSDSQQFRKAVERSATLFGPALSCIMLHREDFLEHWSNGIGKTLRHCRDQGMFRSIGISVYESSLAIKALETEGITIVQVPANVLDRRLEDAGGMALADSLNKTIMIRSVFLQGALLLSPHNLPEKIARFAPYVQSVFDSARRMKVNVRTLCLNFVRERWPRCLVVFGAERASQVKENVDAWKIAIFTEKNLTNLEALNHDVPLEFIRPDLWDDPKPLAAGPRLRLRPMRPSDARGDYKRWMNDPVITRFLESRFRKYTEKDLTDYILLQRKNPDVAFLAIEQIETGKHIGTLKIGPRVPVHETAEIGLMIGNQDHWGRGYATETIALAAEYAFNHFSVRKLTAGCYSANIASEKAFLKNGFVLEGMRMKQVLDQGTPSDVILMGLLRSDWQKRFSSCSIPKGGAS